MPYDEVTLTFYYEKDEYPGGGQLEKVYGRESLVIPHMAHSREQETWVHKQVYSYPDIW